MQANKILFGTIILAMSVRASAQWQSGSDGSDGAFNPAGSVMVDLSLAIPGDALTTPGNGNGVYDATRWVVCFKYTSITVPAGATVTFGMHPSGAPVVWLATGSVTINGRVNLDGEDGSLGGPPTIPYFARPGPGGFEGGQAGHSGATAISFGLGPGSSPTNPPAGSEQDAYGAAYANNVGDWCGVGTGATYGNSGCVPLLGGSGGNADPDEFAGGPWGFGPGGGAGGGAILIAAPTQITVGAAGSVTAQGGDARTVNPSGVMTSGAGSGGAIRLRADTVTLAAGSQIIARGGLGAFQGCCGNFCGTGGDGRVRIEASMVNNSGTISGSQSFPGAPSLVFPASPPRLFITSICSQSISGDPAWGMKTADVQLNSATACQLVIGSSGVPAGTIATVRVIPARGNIITTNSSPISAGGAATASVTFPAGHSEIQLRANW